MMGCTNVDILPFASKVNERTLWPMAALINCPARKFQIFTFYIYSTYFSKLESNLLLGDDTTYSY